MDSTCLLMSVLHVYEISDEYFRYEVTTNTRIEMPEIVEFPSVALSVTEMEKEVKWAQESSVNLYSQPSEMFHNEPSQKAEEKY